MSIVKIISGGQTGADRAALDVAIRLGVPHGGWLPKGRLTEAGPLPAGYRLQELPAAGYPERTERNVIDSDGTVIFSHGSLTGGSRYTAEMAARHKRPFLHLDLLREPATVAAERLLEWSEANSIKVLNVAGTRASENPRIYAATAEVLELALGRPPSGGNR